MSTPTRVNYKKGDRLPPLDVVLVDENGDAIDLTDCSVKFLMKVIGGTTAKVDASATVQDATTGQVRYSWGASDLDAAGNYRGEFEVTDSGSRKRTFPSSGYLAIVVEDDLG